MMTYDLDLMGSKHFGPRYGKVFAPFVPVFSVLRSCAMFRADNSWTMEEPTRYVLPSEFIDNL